MPFLCRLLRLSELASDLVRNRKRILSIKDFPSRWRPILNSPSQVLSHQISLLFLTLYSLWSFSILGFPLVTKSPEPLFYVPNSFQLLSIHNFVSHLTRSSTQPNRLSNPDQKEHHFPQNTHTVTKNLHLFLFIYSLISPGRVRNIPSWTFWFLIHSLILTTSLFFGFMSSYF